MIRWKIALGTLCSLLAIVLMTGTAAAAPPGWTVGRVTDDSSHDWAPRVDGTYVAWTEEGYDPLLGATDDVYVFDTRSSVATKASRSVLQDRLGDVDGGYVVWETWDGTDWEIELYDIAADDLTPLTKNDYDDRRPVMDAGIVAWEASDPDGDGEIMLYDISTGVTTPLTDNDTPDTWPITHSGRVAWSGASGFMLYDHATGVRRIGGAAGYRDMDAGIVAWNSPYPEWEMYTHDIASGVTTRLTHDADIDIWPSVDRGRVVWLGGPLGADGWSFFLHEATSGVTTALLDVPSSWFLDDQPRPFLSGNRVTWTAWDGTDTEVYVYDLGTSAVNVLTDNTYDDGDAHIGPAIDGNRVVWHGRDAGDWEIFLAEFEPPRLVGHVFDELTGLPLAGVSVGASGPSPDGEVTDVDGRFVFSALDPGDYVIGFLEDAHFMEWFDDVYDSAAATTVRVESGEVPLPRDVHLRPLGIYGRVVDSRTGDPVAGALVSAVGPSPRATATGTDGRFALVGFGYGDYGDYLVRVKAAGYQREWYADVRARVRATPISIAPMSSPQDLRIELRPRGRLRP